MNEIISVEDIMNDLEKLGIADPECIPRDAYSNVSSGIRHEAITAEKMAMLVDMVVETLRAPFRTQGVGTYQLACIAKSGYSQRVSIHSSRAGLSSEPEHLRVCWSGRSYSGQKIYVYVDFQAKWLAQRKPGICVTQKMESHPRSMDNIPDPVILLGNCLQRSV